MKSLAAVLLSLFCLTANATPYTELGDTGNLPGDAEDLPDGTDSILGNFFLPDGDVDLYGFSWSGGLFEAEVINFTNTFGDPGDTKLFLFDNAGDIIGFDDDGGTGFLSLLSQSLAAGDYFLGVTEFDNTPLNAAGDNLQNCIVDGSSCGFDVTLASWELDSGVGGDYEIQLNAPVGGIVPVPEPTSLLLIAAAFAGLRLSRSKST